MQIKDKLLLLSALGLSTISAYYSIVGLAALFSAAWLAVVILSTTLEVCKLVLASWLYHNWKKTHLALKSYLTAAVVVLMLITSLGIFGFLSRAHVEQQTENSETALVLEQLNSELSTKQAAIGRGQRDLEQLDRSINLQLDANRVQNALAARRQQQAERDKIKTQLDTMQAETLSLTQRITELKKTQSVQTSKLGPLMYVIELFGGSRDNGDGAVKWIIAVLVLVCDPLAVLMIVAANSSVKPAHNSRESGELRWDPSRKGLVYWHNDKWHSAELPAAANAVDHSDLVLEIKRAVAATTEQQQRVMADLETAIKSQNTQVSAALAAIPQHLMAKLQQSLQDQDAKIKSLIEASMEDWLSKTLTVSYSADHAEIGAIVDKAIAESLAKVSDKTEPPPAPPPPPVQPPENMDNHQGHTIKSSSA